MGTGIGIAFVWVFLGLLLALQTQASLAAYGISCWVRALIEYDAVVKYVAPKRQRLAVAEAEFGALAQSLQEKRAELDRVQRRLTDLADRLGYVLLQFYSVYEPDLKTWSGRRFVSEWEFVSSVFDGLT